MQFTASDLWQQSSSLPVHVLFAFCKSLKALKFRLKNKVQQIKR